jgi:hypothetical protein
MMPHNSLEGSRKWRETAVVFVVIWTVVFDVLVDNLINNSAAPVINVVALLRLLILAPQEIKALGELVGGRIVAAECS